MASDGESAGARVLPYPSRRQHYLLVSLLCLFPLGSAECDQMFSHNLSGPSNGTFEAPIVENPELSARHCVYTFLGLEGERVELVFTRFNLRGTPPDGSTPGVHTSCNHEYIDLYTEIRDYEPNHDRLIEESWGGRYCGHIPPRMRVSLYHVLVIVFYTDKNTTSPDIFQGTYNFINESVYEVGIRTPPNSTCGFTIHSNARNRTGELLSPTYPGVYPKNLKCNYKLLGQEGQRIRLEFRDFDLFFGGLHCPFDNVKVFDGPTTTFPLIGTYCGQQRNLVIYSTSHSLYITFTTLQRTSDTQNRGFQCLYEFSESYVKLDFIKIDGTHIRGTECDQKILSKGESHGEVLSPNYPYLYMPRIVCRYYIYGKKDHQHLERVTLSFEKFDVSRTTDEDSNRVKGFVRLYLRGQEERGEWMDPDFEYFGKNIPGQVTSEGPRLVMVFSAGEMQGSGFKASYKFDTDYQIPGHQEESGSCHFTYNATLQRSGDFNSPRYPSNYPANTTCNYIFLASKNEKVHLVFDHFKVRADNANRTYGFSCQEDWLEIYNKYSDNSDVLIGRYCGSSAPGPMASKASATGLKVVLHTDDSSKDSGGFKASYFFERIDEHYSQCSGNITKEVGGEITSPDFPNKYKSEAMACNWEIHAEPGYRVLLIFKTFQVEGNMEDRGCPSAVVRIHTSADSEPIELCGENLSEQHQQIISKSNVLFFSFMTAQKSAGAKGFRAVWSQIKEGPDCEEFHCHTSRYCISEKLKCNSIPNCGLRDASDEDKCIQATEVDVFLLLGVGLGVSFVILIGLCICCHRKRKRRRPRDPSLTHSPHRQHVCDHHASASARTGARFASVDSV